MKVFRIVLVGFALMLAMFAGFGSRTASAVDDTETSPDFSTIEGGIPTGPMHDGVSFALRDAVIKNNSTSNISLRICKDWSGTASDPDCKSGSATGTLSPGQNSKTKYGWKDADGILNVPVGYCIFTLSNTKILTGTGTKDMKISGFYGATFTYRIDPC